VVCCAAKCKSVTGRVYACDSQQFFCPGGRRHCACSPYACGASISTPARGSAVPSNVDATITRRSSTTPDSGWSSDCVRRIFLNASARSLSAAARSRAAGNTAAHPDSIRDSFDSGFGADLIRSAATVTRAAGGFRAALVVHAGVRAPRPAK
jgi:hypothetical protein